MMSQAPVNPVDPDRPQKFTRRERQKAKKVISAFDILRQKKRDRSLQTHIDEDWRSYHFPRKWMTRNAKKRNSTRPKKSL